MDSFILKAQAVNANSRKPIIGFDYMVVEVDPAGLVRTRKLAEGMELGHEMSVEIPSVPMIELTISRMFFEPSSALIETQPMEGLGLVTLKPTTAVVEVPIRLIVRDSDGNPVYGAEVVIESFVFLPPTIKSPIRQVKSGLTDEGGYLERTVLPSNVYRISVTKSGFHGARLPWIPYEPLIEETVMLSRIAEPARMFRRS